MKREMNRNIVVKLYIFAALCIMLLVGMQGFRVVMAEGEQAATQCELTDYADVTLELYKTIEDIEKGEQLELLENGQSMFFLLRLSGIKNQELLTRLYQTPGEIIDFSVDADFVNKIQGNYPTEINPTNFDNVAVFEGKPLFRWWVDGKKIKIRFDEDWINDIVLGATQLGNLAFGFEGDLNVENNGETGKITIEVAGQKYIVPLKTDYTLDKKVSAPMYRSGRYVADYTVSFSVSQDMDISTASKSGEYSAIVTLKDTLAATGSALTGNIVDGPFITGPTDGLTVSVQNNGTENTFSLGGATIIKKGTYTITYTMKVSNDAVVAKLKNYDTNNTVELLENGDSLVVKGVETPLIATASLEWDEDVSNRQKIAKKLIPYSDSSDVYILDNHYYVDYYVVVYLKDEFSTFTVLDTIQMNLEHSDLPVTLEGADYGEGYWNARTEEAVERLEPVSATIVTQLSGTNNEKREIIVTAPQGTTLQPGAYFLKVPCDVTEAVSAAAETKAQAQYKNRVELELVDGAEPIAVEPADETGYIQAPTNFVKRGYIVTNNAGIPTIYNDGNANYKLIQWEMEFGWNVPDPSMIVEDVMKDGQILLLNNSYPFVVQDTTILPATNLASLTSKTDTAYLTFTTVDGNEKFTFEPGKMVAQDNEVAGKYKITYYTMVPEATTDFSTKKNEWSITYPNNSTAVPQIGPTTGEAVPTLGANVKLALSKNSGFNKVKYDLHDTITEWEIVIDNTQNRIPMNSLTKLELTDVAKINKRNEFVPASMSIWYDFEANDGKYAPIVTMVRADNSELVLTRGVHYSLQIDAQDPAKFEMVFDTLALAGEMNGQEYFKNIKIVSYLYNNDCNNAQPSGTKPPQVEIQNDAMLDYAVAHQDLETLKTTAVRVREFTTVLKDLQKLDGEMYADFVGEDGKKELMWRLEIGAAEFNMDMNVDIRIEDTLPANMKLLDDGVNWRDSFHIESRDKHVVIDMSDATFSWNEETNTFTLDFVKPYENWPDQEWNIYIDYYTVFKDGVLQEELNKVPAGSPATVTMEDVSNNAKVYWKGMLLEEPSDTQDVVIKDIVLEKTAEWLEATGSRVRYTIDINPYSLDQGQGDVIELEDSMGNGKEFFVYLEESFKVVNRVTGKEMVAGTTPSETDYVLEMSDDGKSFKLIVPDETYVRLVYEVKTTKPVGSGSVALDNSATLGGRRPAPTGITFTVRSTYQMGNFYVQSGEVGIRVLKVDGRTIADTPMTVLPGAQFTKTELDIDGTIKGTPTVLTTDADGILEMTESLLGTKIFLIEETAAPTGYELSDTPWRWCYIMTLAGVDESALAASLEDILDCGVTIVAAGTYVDEIVPNDPTAVIIRKYNENGLVLDGAEFVLKDSNGNIVSADSNYNMAGSLRFTQLPSGTYTLEETKAPQGYDINSEHEWTFTVDANGRVSVADDADYTLFTVDADGLTINITNYKTLPVTVDVAGEKTLNGRAPQSGEEFSFQIRALTSGAPLPSGRIVTNGAWTGNKADFSFGTIIFTKPGSYVYEIREANTGVSGITYDPTIYTVTVEVSDTPIGQLEETTTITKRVGTGSEQPASDIAFVNTYESTGSLTISGNKELIGKALKGNDFSFTLYKVNGNSETGIETVSNAADGTIAFSPITYSTGQDGTYIYRVKENAVYGNGITCDNSVYTITVVVEDDGAGNMTTSTSMEKTTVSGTETATSILFKNIYEANGSVTFDAIKTLNGRPLMDGEFGFALYEVTGSEERLLQTKRNAADGSIRFDAINYTLDDVGTHTYTVKENADTIAGITFDETVYTIKVTVTDKGDGTLNIASVITRPLQGGGEEVVTDMTFMNTYEANGSVIFSGTKTLTGRILEAGEFSFALYDVTETPEVLLSTVTNNQNGAITFAEIPYTLQDVGIHKYEVREILGTLGGVTYSTAVHAIEVTVADAGDGTLVVSSVGDYDDFNFTNIYSATGSVTFGGTKTLTGKTLHADDFTFHLYEVIGTTETLLESVNNAADGTYAFTSIDYTLADVGEHIYKVTEEAGSMAGVTYDTKEYNFTVTVTDAGDGTLTIDSATDYDELDFANEYTATGSITFGANKTLNGRELRADEFRFELYEVTGSGEALIETVTNAANGEIRFTEIIYTLDDVGTHTYTVKEKGGSLGGITQYDGAVYTIIVTVSDNGDGTLNVTSVITRPLQGGGEEVVTGMEFTNIYEATGNVTFSGTKTLTGRVLQADEFSFGLYKVDGLGETLLETVTNAQNGNIIFGRIEYTEDDLGTHYYRVKEMPGTLSGITYASTIYDITVEVTDNGDGTLRVTPSENYDDLDFINTYAATGTVVFGGMKTLAGRTLSADDFSFSLYSVNGATETLLETVGNAADGTIAFTSITYQTGEAGTYVYKVKENDEGKPGVTYDATEYTITVVVEDDGAGTLSATTSMEKTTASGNEAATAILFENTYSASGSVIFSGNKSLTGRALSAGEFGFELYEVTGSGNNLIQTVYNEANGAINFNAIPYTLADVGTHNYRVKEIAGTLGGITYDATVYDITVTVADDGDGTLVVTPTDNYNKLNFVNDYQANGRMIISGRKTLTGKTLANEQFSFGLYDNAQNQVAVAKNAADGRIAFTLEYTIADVGTHIYKVREITGNEPGITYDSTEHTIAVTVADNGDGTLRITAGTNYNTADFVNNYSASGEVTIAGTKTLSGRALKGEEFEFELVNSFGTVIQTVKNDANGRIAFEKLKYTVADVGMHTYTVREKQSALPGVIYDTTEYTVVVEVADGGDGSLTVDTLITRPLSTGGNEVVSTTDFANIYRASGNITFSGKKTLNGDTLAADAFVFGLYDENDNLLESVRNTANGDIVFGAISYDEADMGRHIYKVREITGNSAGVTYDSTVHTITVNVTDNGDGTLNVSASSNYNTFAFVNTYEATGSVTFSGNKVLTGRVLREGEFSFELYDDAGTLLQTVSNATNGSITFNTITYDISDVGVKTYTVREASGTKPGVQYDNTIYTVQVEITDNGDGTLTVVPSVNANALDFANVYEATGGLTIEAIKVLDGRILVAEEFEFGLYDDAGNLLASTKNADNGKITFAEIQYDLNDVGEYVYTVKEMPGTRPGVQYDATEYTVVVNVTDKGDSNLQAEITEIRRPLVAGTNEVVNAITFENKYEAAGSVVFKGTKTLEGKTLEAGQFQFGLYDSSNTLLGSVSNAADGSITFNELRFTLNDIGAHTYTVKEMAGTLPDISYDRSVYTVSIIVSDNGDGTLNVSASANSQMLNFVNRYQTAVQPTPQPSNPTPPQETPAPATPTPTPVPQHTLPKTGDDAQLLLWLVVMLVSGAGLVLCYKKLRKK